ncbi:MAG: hypothetical protein ARM1_0419 [Candidatus Micrarchaeota archaeon]|nr:MAG: hypothetical protein ARM1_0419 [Candidatus Micrarchaeota archaeon]
MKIQTYIIAMLIMLLITPLSRSYFIINYTNVTIHIYENGSALVNELYNIYITNTSIQQYYDYRVDLNLTVGQWASILGRNFTFYIVNPKYGVSDVTLLPGAPSLINAQFAYAYIDVSYFVRNLTIINKTAPRLFTYTFNDSFLNFLHTVSGEIIPASTSLNIILPNGSTIKEIYPLPDYPAGGVINSYKNVTRVSWFKGEPLNNFKLVFQIREPIAQEVISNVSSLYHYLGYWLYALLALLFIIVFLVSYKRSKG